MHRIKWWANRWQGMPLYGRRSLQPTQIPPPVPDACWSLPVESSHQQDKLFVLYFSDTVGKVYWPAPQYVFLVHKQWWQHPPSTNQQQLVPRIWSYSGRSISIRGNIQQVLHASGDITPHKLRKRHISLQFACSPPLMDRFVFTSHIYKFLLGSDWIVR